MAQLTVLAVDDEDLALNDLAWLLSQAENVATVLVAKSGTEALKVLSARDDIDALFLDVMMPGLNGIELVRLLQNYKSRPAVAFVTAHEEYAIDAFDLEACDYLLKPVDQSRLEETLRRVVRTHSGDDIGGECIQMLTCRVGNRSYTVQRDEINIVEAAGDLVRVTTSDGKSHLIRESISSLTAAWSPRGFLRVHRSYLVRASEITKVRTADGARSIEIGDQELPVSRRYSRLLEDYFARADR